MAKIVGLLFFTVFIGGLSYSIYRNEIKDREALQTKQGDFYTNSGKRVHLIYSYYIKPVDDKNVSSDEIRKTVDEIIASSLHIFVSQEPVNTWYTQPAKTYLVKEITANINKLAVPNLGVEVEIGDILTLKK